MTEKSRLRWRCRRGMKELDILLLRYLECCYDSASPQEQGVFAEILELQDPQLYALITGRERPPDEAFADVVRKLSCTQT